MEDQQIAPLRQASAEALATLIRQLWGTPDAPGLSSGGYCSIMPGERFLAEELLDILTKYAPWHPEARRELRPLSLREFSPSDGEWLSPRSHK